MMSGAAARKVVVLGVPVDPLTMAEALDAVEGAIERRERIQIGVVNAAKIVNMRRNPALRDAVLSSDMIFADGMGVVWASRILGKPLPERVAGIDLMAGMLARAHAKRYRVFFLGATDEVLDKTIERVRASFPDVVVAGRHNGYFTEEEEEAVARLIRDSRADILFVAITSPKKEKFLAKWGALANATVCHGVGGSFDVYAGKVQRAPESWQRLGLEWLFRLKQEPGRLWKRYLVTNTIFSWMVLGAFVKRTFAAAGPAERPGR